MTDVPHFDLPFHFEGSSVAEVEQDSIHEVVDCIEIILRTHVGLRDYVPEFGAPDLVFKNQPIGVDDLTSIITSQEPRASLVISEHPDVYDEMIDRIQIQANVKEGGSI
jgi:hypothetical protein